MKPPAEPLCLKVNEAARMIGVGRTKLYELERFSIIPGHIRTS